MKREHFASHRRHGDREVGADEVRLRKIAAAVVHCVGCSAAGLPERSGLCSAPRRAELGSTLSSELVGSDQSGWHK